MIKAAAAAVFVVTGVSGCGVSGEAVAAEPFDGCAEIPDDALVAAGLDPATEEAGIYGKQVDDWLMCTWRSDWYFLTVAGTEMTMDEVVSNPDSVGFRDVVVGGRTAVEHHQKGDPEIDSCILAFDTQRGVTMLRIDKAAAAELVEDPCDALERDAVPLITYLPE